jgi:hypothetical protein
MLQPFRIRINLSLREVQTSLSCQNYGVVRINPAVSFAEYHEQVLGFTYNGLPIICNCITTCDSRQHETVLRNWNTPNAERTQIMLNGIQGHRRFSLLSCTFTATPAVQQLRSESHVKEFATRTLSHATQKFRHSPCSLDSLMCIC